MVVMTFCRRAPGSPPAVHTFRRLRWRGGCRRRGVALEEGGKLGGSPRRDETAPSIGTSSPASDMTPARRRAARLRSRRGQPSRSGCTAEKSAGIDCKARPNNSRAGTQESPTRPATSGLGSAVGWLPAAATPLSRVIYPRVNGRYPFRLEVQPEREGIAGSTVWKICRRRIGRRDESYWHPSRVILCGGGQRSTAAASRLALSARMRALRASSPGSYATVPFV